MYTRSDDPKQLPHKNLIALAVILVIGVLLFFLISNLWGLAQLNSKLGSGDIQDSLEATITDEGVAAAAEARGLSASGNDITTVLFVITSTAEDGTPTLSALNLAALNETQDFAKLLEISPEACVGLDESTNSLAQLWADGGISAVARGVSVAGTVPISHIIVMSSSGWETFMSTASQGSAALRSNATELLSGIQESDMGIADLFDVVTRAMSAGLSTSDIEQVEMIEESDAEGNTYLMLNGDQIALSVGTLA